MGKKLFFLLLILTFFSQFFITSNVLAIRCSCYAPQATEPFEVTCSGNDCSYSSCSMACSPITESPRTSPATAEETPEIKEVTLNVPIGGLKTLPIEKALGEYIKAWYKLIVGSVGIIATVLIMIAGFKWLSSAGDSKKIGDAKDMIFSAIIGLLIAFLSYTVLYLINPNLTIINLPDRQMANVEGDSSPERARRAFDSRDDVDSSGLGLWDPFNHRAVQILQQLPGVARVTTYSGHDNDRGTGWAADVWPTSESAGDEVATWIMENADELNLSYVIWEQSIWNPSRDGAPRPLEDWRGMEDRGGATANHFDHIHVSFKP